MSITLGTRQAYTVQTDRMSTLQAQIDKLQAQVSTGKKIVDPSDDPVGSARVAQLQRALDNNAQFVRNMGTLTAKLNVADSAASSIANDLTRVRELALNAANGTLTDGDRKNIASELDQISADMLALANTRDSNGDYVFAGTKSNAPAYAADMTGAIVYQGATDVASVAVGEDTAMKAGVTGADLLTPPGGADDVFKMLSDFKTLLAQPTPLTDQNKADYASLLDGLQGAIGQVNDTRAAFGGRLNTIDTEQSRLSDVATTLTANQSSLESADVASVITQMQNMLLILKASQQSFAQVSSMSLFNYIK